LIVVLQLILDRSQVVAQQELHLILDQQLSRIAGLEFNPIQLIPNRLNALLIPDRETIHIIDQIEFNLKEVNLLQGLKDKVYLLTIEVDLLLIILQLTVAPQEVVVTQLQAVDKVEEADHVDNLF
jgi:hypothetical protein